MKWSKYVFLTAHDEHGERFKILRHPYLALRERAKDAQSVSVRKVLARNAECKGVFCHLACRIGENLATRTNFSSMRRGFLLE